MQPEERGRIIELRTVDGQELALVEIGGSLRPVFVEACVHLKVGDYVKIRAGAAIELD